jgi:AcrR family transcriptional regulator
VISLAVARPRTQIRQASAWLIPWSDGPPDWIDRMSGQANSRRDELLELAATMFAARGLRATTVRDIADGAGILSGSLYHHFSSKEEMVDELLRGFLDRLFARYNEIMETEKNPLERLKGLFMASFEAIEHQHAQVVIYQDEAKRLSAQPRFSYIDDMNRQQRKMWVELLNQGIGEGYFRPDLDVDLVYRFIRDTTWVSVQWYQPGGPLTAQQVGRQYLAIVLGGITADFNKIEEGV